MLPGKVLAITPRYPYGLGYFLGKLTGIGFWQFHERRARCIQSNSAQVVRSLVICSHTFFRLTTLAKKSFGLIE